MTQKVAVVEIVFDKEKLDIVNIDLLRPNTWNPKDADTPEYRRIVNSLRQNGQRLPVVVRSNDGFEIIDGEQRWRGLQELGSSEILIYDEGEVEDQRARELTIAYEQQVPFNDVELGGLLADMMEQFGEIEIPYSKVETSELMELYEAFAGTGQGIKDDDPPPVSEEDPITQMGDLWLLGKHRVLCGDSTKAEDVERVMDGEKADMVFTDPPYGMGLDTDWSDCIGSIGRQNRTKGNKYEPVIGDDEPFDPIHLFAIECSEMFLFGADYYAERIPQRDQGSWLVWDKRKESQKDAIGSEFELIWSKNKHKRRMLRHDWFGFLSSDNQQDARKRVHPTQKPVSLCADIMNQWGNDGDVIYDAYLGSGTTLIAADQLDRICIGLEICPKYVDVIVQRYINHIGSDEHVSVERDGKRLSWNEAQLAKKPKVTVC